MFEINGEEIYVTGLNPIDEAGFEVARQFLALEIVPFAESDSFFLKPGPDESNAVYVADFHQTGCVVKVADDVEQFVKKAARLIQVRRALSDSDGRPSVGAVARSGDRPQQVSFQPQRVLRLDGFRGRQRGCAHHVGHGRAGDGDEGERRLVHPVFVAGGDDFEDRREVHHVAGYAGPHP